MMAKRVEQVQFNNVERCSTGLKDSFGDLVQHRTTAVCPGLTGKNCCKCFI